MSRRAPSAPERQAAAAATALAGGIQRRWFSLALVDALAWPGTESFVMNLVATVDHDRVFIFALHESVHWLALSELEHGGLQAAGLGQYDLGALVTAVRGLPGANVTLAGGHGAVLVATRDGHARLMQFDGKALVEAAVIRNEGPGDDLSVWGVASLHHRPIVAMSSNTHLINLVDLSDLAHPVTYGVLRGHGHNIPQIDVSDDDARLVSASIDGSVRIWDLASRTLLYSCSFDGGHVWGWAVAFFPAAYASEPLFYATSVADDATSVGGNAGASVDRTEESPPYPRNMTDNETPEGGGGEYAPMSVTPRPASATDRATVLASLSDHDDDLVVFCNQDCVYLMTGRLTILDRFQIGADCCQFRRAFGLGSYGCRMALLRAIPHLALVLFACTRSRKATVLRIVREGRAPRLQFIRHIPTHTQSSAVITGLHVAYGPVRPTADHDQLHFWDLFLLHANGIVCCYNVGRAAFGRGLHLLPAFL